MVSGGICNGNYIMSWNSEFAEPIDLPNNIVATTLRQVTAYIGKLPEAEQNSREWKNARKRMRQAADQVGSIWFARIAIVRDREKSLWDFRLPPRFRRRTSRPRCALDFERAAAQICLPSRAGLTTNRGKIWPTN